MSNLTRILDHDLHRSKSLGNEARVYFIETPGRPEFIPCIVSASDKGRFLVNESITKENRIRSGAFYCAEESLDDVIPAMLEKTYELSRLKNFKNIFDNVPSAFKYISNASGYKSQPHICIAPSSMDDDLLSKKCSSLGYLDGTISKSCKVLRYEVPYLAFFSRPDFVGLYTRLPNNYNSIILHNVELGISFCVI